MEYIKLNTGIEIPIIGSGTNTFGKVNGDYTGDINNDTKELKDAIALGYRHFDTAIAYRNEAVVGKAINESGLMRSEFFITSKIPGRIEHYETEKAVRNSIQSSLKELDTDYIDLYLIHHPWDDLESILKVWRILEEAVDKGTLKAIGVSNFEEKELVYLTQHARIQPAVNQIESHPSHWNAELIKLTNKLNIIPEAWGPLSRVSDEAKTTLSTIGNKYDKTWAQVILRYQIEQNIIVIPKSHNKERQAQNLDIFDFELTAQERDTISKL